jgi:hypothetical protein
VTVSGPSHKTVTSLRYILIKNFHVEYPGIKPVSCGKKSATNNTHRFQNHVTVRAPAPVGGGGNLRVYTQTITRYSHCCVGIILSNI